MTLQLGKVECSASGWTNIIASIGAAASVDVYVQSVSNSLIEIVWGGSDPGASGAGMILTPYQSMFGNAAAIWVRGTGPVIITKEG